MVWRRIQLQQICPVHQTTWYLCRSQVDLSLMVSLHWMNRGHHFQLYGVEMLGPKIA